MFQTLFLMVLSFSISTLPAFAQVGSLNLEKVSINDLPSIPIDSQTTGTDSKVAFQSALQKQLDRCLLLSNIECFHPCVYSLSFRFCPSWFQ